MRWPRIPLLSLVALACGLCLAPAARAETLLHGGRERRYLLHIPPGPRAPRPLFLLLHPGGSHAQQFRRATRFDAEADLAGAVVVYPQGISGHWNDGRTTADGALVRTGDDTGFLLALIDRLAEDGLVDPSAVHVAGHSNGGMMAMRLACEAPERLRSVAAVSASLPAGLACPGAARPVAALLLRGALDPYLPLAGGQVKGEDSRGTVLSADATLAAFARRNGCRERATRRVEVTRGADRSSADVTTFASCAYAPTVAITVQGSGHGWPGVPYGPRMTAMIGPAAPAFRASAVIARFFAAREVP